MSGECICGAVYVPCVYSHVSGSYRRWSRCHVLCHVMCLCHHVLLCGQVEPTKSEQALDGLKQVMSVKSRVVLPYLIPQVSKPHLRGAACLY